jgi:N-acetylneuraminic acid mutarotase
MRRLVTVVAHRTLCAALLAYLLVSGLPRAFAVESDGTWKIVPSMAHSHCLGSTLLLRNGTVLVVAGIDSSGFTAVSELFDPITETWSFAGNVHQLRHNWRDNLVNLPGGRALLVGGADAAVDSLSSVELYDPGARSWSFVASMNVARRQPAVVALQDGRVLVAAGARTGSDGGRFLSSAEIYDPATDSWAFTGSMHVAREIGGTVRLQDGRVLVAGGEGPWFTPGDTAEVYDPSTGQWTLTAPMPYGWFGGASMVVLRDGRVLAAGGYNGTTLPMAIVYDPATNSWSYTGSMLEPRSGGSIALLADGTVLIAGGGGGNGQSLATAETYDPATGRWSAAETMNATHSAPNEMAMLPNGDVLLVGACPAQTQNIAERFTGPITLVGPPTDKRQCMGSGWKIFNNPSFKNQGQCVSFVESGRPPRT